MQCACASLCAPAHHREHHMRARKSNLVVSLPGVNYRLPSAKSHLAKKKMIQLSTSMAGSEHFPAMFDHRMVVVDL